MKLLSTPKIGTVPSITSISKSISMTMQNKSIMDMMTNTKALKRKVRSVKVSTILKS